MTTRAPAVLKINIPWKNLGLNTLNHFISPPFLYQMNLFEIESFWKSNVNKFQEYESTTFEFRWCVTSNIYQGLFLYYCLSNVSLPTTSDGKVAESLKLQFTWWTLNSDFRGTPCLQDVWDSDEHLHYCGQRVNPVGEEHFWNKTTWSRFWS